MTFIEKDFDEIRPYNNDEIIPAFQRITKDPHFISALEYLFESEAMTYLEKVKGFTSTYDFQRDFMGPVIRKILDKTSAGITWAGFENLDPAKAYLFISNHRDIFLDSAILQLLLVEQGLDTSEISFGSNLIESDLIKDVIKVNKMFTVIREGGLKEMWENSRRLSAYIRKTITSKNCSVWIAQRGGRTKDGNDKTQQALLKMLNVSGTSDFEQNFLELNVVPISISYEFEPCDALKVRELNLSKEGKYKKKPGEDFNSTLTGITQFKGRIRLVIGKIIQKELKEIGDMDKNYEQLAEVINEEIYYNYQLWPNNFIAHDLLNKSTTYKSNYTKTEKEVFLKYMREKLSPIEGDKAELEHLFLTLYANPIKNCLDRKLSLDARNFSEIK